MFDVARRVEERTAIQLDVDLSSLDIREPAQEGVTQNVSPRGARVVTRKPWRPNDRLNVRSLRGNLLSRARVVYCQRLDDGSFAVGLELYVTLGDWTSPASRKPGKVRA